MKPRNYDVLLLAAASLACWEILYLLVGADVVSSPSATLLRVATLLRTEHFWRDAMSTGKAFAYACAIGIFGGLLAGLGLGFNRFAGDVADPILGTVYSIPKITLYPIILLMFGLSPAAQIAFGVIHGIFPVAIFTMNAVRNVAPVHHRTAKALRLSAFTTVVSVLAPAAVPEILSGIRVGVALTLLGILIGELFASSSGIGFALMRATDLHDVVGIFALTLLLFLFAVAINSLLRLAEERVHHRA
jgi:NitT/TauT family transport system permease protein